MFGKIDKKLSYRILTALFVTVLVIMPCAAYANVLDQVVTNGFCVIINALTGNVGKAIATFAILFLGIGAFFGKVNWGLALMFAAGIVAIFGSAEIAASIAAGSGGSAGSAC